MAIVRAVKTGNWSDTTVWNTGALPTSADDVFSNNFTITIDISPTVLSIQNGSTTGVTAGGTFVPNNGITLTCTAANGIVANSSGSLVFACSLAAGQACALVGNIVVVDAPISFGGVANGSAGTLNITGNVSTTSTSGGRVGVRNAGTGVVNITGQVSGSSSGNAAGYGVENASSGTLNIVGNGVAGTISVAIYSASPGTINVTGQLQSSNGVPALYSTSSSAVNILSGPFLTSNNGTSPVVATRWFWQNTTPPATYYQIRSANLSVIRPLYTADSVGGNPAVANVRSGTVYGPAGELTGTCAVPPAGSVALGVPVDNTTGTAVLTQENFQAALTAQGLTTARAANLDNLDATVSSRLPTTGYTAPPSAATNASAVRTELSTELSRVDATISSRLPTASYQPPLDASGTRAAIGLASANLDSQLDSLPTAAENASAVRTELVTELARLDVAISTRLATSSYTTPPTASAIATAVNSALDRTGFSLTSGERQAIATAVEQSILNENDGQAILNAIVGAIGNQNIDQVALVAAIRADLERSGGTLATRSTLTASQVRTELAPELGNLDATVSSRLPSSGYTAPPSAASIATTAWSAANRTLTANPGPSAADNATAVRTELSTELSRIDATVSSRLKPSDTLARVTLTDTATSLTNAPTVPTPGQIADEVRTELTPELSRVANCATTQEVGDIVQDALET